MSSNLKISVVVRYHESGKLDYLFTALASIVNQTYSNLEIILCLQNVDNKVVQQIKNHFEELNSSRPKTDPRDLKIHQINCEPNIDLRSRLFTEGLLLATGDFLAFLDYDDIVYDYAYETLISLFPKDPTYALIAGNVNRSIYLTIQGEERLVSSIPYVKRKHSTHELFHHNVLPLHTYMIRTACLKGLPIEENLKNCRCSRTILFS